MVDITRIESITIKNLYVHQGASFRYVAQILDSKGDPVDLHYFEFSGQIRRTYESDNFYEFDIEIISESEGQIGVTLSADLTGSIPMGRYLYDIFAYDVSNNKSYKILSGIFELVPSVTRQ